MLQVQKIIKNNFSLTSFLNPKIIIPSQSLYLEGRLRIVRFDKNQLGNQ
jgi:hypothetical protein